MKKILLAIFLGIALAIASVSVGLAQTEKINIEGEITAVDEVTQTITIRTAEEEEFEIHFREGKFDFSEEDLGAFGYVKGILQEDGTILALWVKLMDGEDGGKEGNAYCSGEKDTPHPLAIVLATGFEKDVEEIMAYYCDGSGFGQIYLALQTEVITGVDYGILLAERSDGKSWGEIWKDLGYNGKPKDKTKEKTSPGQEKNEGKGETPLKAEKEENKDQGKDKSPPGQGKDKGKNPKKDKGK